MILYHTHNQQQFVNYEEMAKKKNEKLWTYQ